MTLVTVALAAVLVTAGCRNVVVPEQDPATVTYTNIPGGVRVSDYTKLPSGVYYLDVATGSGAAAVNKSTLSYTYRGWLPDGRVIDSTATGATPSSFVLGQGQVIAGWDLGLVGVRGGGRRRLLIPPALGYGDHSVGTRIPAGSVLVFEIDVPTVTLPSS